MSKHNTTKLALEELKDVERQQHAANVRVSGVMRRARVAAGVSLQDAAAAMVMTTPFLSRLEAGSKPWDEHKIRLMTAVIQRLSKDGKSTDSRAGTRHKHYHALQKIRDNANELKQLDLASREARHCLFQMSYNIGRLAELTGLGREVYDAARPYIGRGEWALLVKRIEALLAKSNPELT